MTIYVYNVCENVYIKFNNLIYVIHYKKYITFLTFIIVL